MRAHETALSVWTDLGCQPHLVQALEAEKLGLERARAEARARAREEAEGQTTAAAKERDGRGDFFSGDGARLRPGPMDEELCLRSATMKYIRGSIGAGQLYETMTGRGRVEEAVIAKVARGMPEDKAWALMDAHRRWRFEERLNKKRFRASRRAEAIARRKAKMEDDASVESEGGDDRQVCSTPQGRLCP